MCSKRADHAPETEAQFCVDKHSKIVDQPILRAGKGELILKKTFNFLNSVCIAFKICSPSLQ